MLVWLVALEILSPFRGLVWGVAASFACIDGSGGRPGRQRSARCGGCGSLMDHRLS